MISDSEAVGNKNSRLHIPIAMKLVLMATIVLLGATLPIADQVAKHFAKRSEEAETIANLEQARARADEVESLLDGFRDKIKLIASLVGQPYSSPDDKKSALRLSFFEDKDLVSLEVWKMTADGPELTNRLVREDYLSTYGVSGEYIALLRTSRPFPLEPLFAGRVEVRNSSLPDGVPLLTMGLGFVRDEFQKISHVAVADFRLDRVQRVFAASGVRTPFLLDKDGTVLAHPEDHLAVKAINLSHLPLVDSGRVSKVSARSERYYHPEDKESYIGAYARTSYGVTSYSHAKEKAILEPAEEARRLAFFITGLALSGAILFVFLFSMRITNPIERLLDLTREIANGNFDINARRNVRSRDEVGELAVAFDAMTTGLKERDRVKTMFSKFHGSSVAEDILRNSGASLRGTSRMVTVFFSDIRDFTQFSEGHTPEEVVQMLNEYFEIMVGIINQSGGVVDKFIGDAIMAVWGAPTSSGHDAEDAIQACLKMRSELEKLNQRRVKRGKTPIKIGMGVHSGPVISGTVGSQERMEYTVIGDTVNMAARIESATKDLGFDLLLSEPTAFQVNKKFQLEPAGTVSVKGKSQPLTLYRVA